MKQIDGYVKLIGLIEPFIWYAYLCKTNYLFEAMELVARSWFLTFITTRVFSQAQLLPFFTAAKKVPLWLINTFIHLSMWFEIVLELRWSNKASIFGIGGYLPNLLSLSVSPSLSPSLQGKGAKLFGLSVQIPVHLSALWLSHQEGLCLHTIIAHHFEGE